ncbi:MAG: flagellar biosynthetic protein FliQ, partial [Singulisphaera sp.]|nr:flagellar biosynthetic protein FliQ [Singulisphaera sp.]
PRLVAVLLVVLAILPWLVGRWIAFAVGLIEGIPERL